MTHWQNPDITQYVRVEKTVLNGLQETPAGGRPDAARRRAVLRPESRDWHQLAAIPGDRGYIVAQEYRLGIQC